MFRIIATAVGLSLMAVPSWGQPDRGKPKEAYVYIKNNTKEEVRITISSAVKTVVVILKPNEYCKCVLNQSITERTMTVFSTKTKKLLSGHLVDFVHNNEYDAVPDGDGPGDSKLDGGRKSVPPTSDKLIPPLAPGKWNGELP
jgi:hypothetical protein